MSIITDHIISQFFKPTILVLGDIMLDVYLNGTTTRLSPEAPVPVVNVQEEQSFIGGAANVAANLRSLGAKVCFCSVSGKDEGSEKVIGKLDEMGINTDHIIQDPGRHTIIKERIMADSRILARFDKGSEDHISAGTENRLVERLKAVYPLCDAVVIADYGKGVLTPGILHALKKLRKAHPVFLAVDSKDLIKFKPLSPSLVKPNYEESLKLLGLQQAGEDRVKQIKNHGRNICGKTGATLTVVTMDAEGAIAFAGQKTLCQVHARHIDSPHVIGAGDTFISALTLSLICSDSVADALELASAAASISVAKENTACCSNLELRSFFAHQRKNIDSLQTLEEICNLYRKQGKRIVFTNGCFDILHSGHVNYLHQAAKLGDVMIVGLNNDESIRRLKGHNRPINPMGDRIEVLGALGVVDHIVPFGKPEDDTPIEIIKAVRPDIFVKGGDYTKDKLPEAGVVEAYGGEISFISLVPDHSTTNVIRRIRAINTPIRVARSS
jgi:D-beta-D-heptose 7-phosphate kinase/D-beta-D-heptose 1-phosphate adenosyltransferase